MVADDFGPSTGTSETAKRASEDSKGAKRSWLKVYETLPPQMLNAYGPAKFSKMSDSEVWRHLATPLKSCGMYMTEMASDTAERRGVCVNRWLHAVKVFCEYQQQPGIRKANDSLLNSTKCSELYDEITRILPSLSYCLAPQMHKAKTGASSLRSGMQTESVGVTRDEGELDSHAKILYEWLDTSKVSRVRMLLHWQSAGGLSYVAAVHHRAAQCFRYQGNSQHGDDAVVSLLDFQAAIKSRHRVGTSGIGSEDPNEQGSADFA